MKFSDIRQAAREGRASVHLHGFCNLPDGGQEYCDDPALIDGWAIYVRVETPDDPQQPFDLHELPDHQTYTSAEGAARAIALPCLSMGPGFARRSQPMAAPNGIQAVGAIL